MFVTEEDEPAGSEREQVCGGDITRAPIVDADQIAVGIKVDIDVWRVAVVVADSRYAAEDAAETAARAPSRIGVETFPQSNASGRANCVRMMPLQMGS